MAVFERNEGRNNHAPRIDDAESVTIDPAGGNAALNLVRDTPFQKVGFKPQETDFSAYGLEMIFVPTYTAAYEWQGTVIFNKFDPSGGYIGQYVADVIINANSTTTFVNFEASFEGEDAWLEYGNPNVWDELGNPGAGGGVETPPITSHGKAKNVNANYQLNPFRLGQRIGRNPRVRTAVKCNNIGGSAGVSGCAASSLFDFGATFAPCTLGIAVSVAVGCTMYAIFGN